MDTEALARALGALAPVLAPRGERVVELKRLSGGASQETFAFRVEGAGPSRELILRKRPDGMAPVEGSTALPLATEAALISAAARAGAPTPEIVRVCEPEDGVGEAYVMSRVEGETLGRRIVRDAAFAQVRPGLARQCGEVLARIHAVPPDGLPPLRASDAVDELERYEQVYRASGAARPIFDLAFRTLRERAPATAPHRTLVHGDFRNGNIMFSPTDGVAAVLDWELAHIGDPAMDMGWLCTNSWRFGEHRKPVGGFGAYDDLLAGYASVAGAAPSLREVLFWQMLGSLKWGCMCLTMYGIYASGADPSVERAMIGRRVSETEVDLIALLEREA